MFLDFSTKDEQSYYAEQLYRGANISYGVFPLGDLDTVVLEVAAGENAMLFFEKFKTVEEAIARAEKVASDVAFGDYDENLAEYIDLPDFLDGEPSA